MGVNSLPKTVSRQRRGCDLNPGPTAPESSTLTTRLPSHPKPRYLQLIEATACSSYTKKFPCHCPVRQCRVLQISALPSFAIPTASQVNIYVFGDGTSLCHAVVTVSVSVQTDYASAADQSASRLYRDKPSYKHNETATNKRPCNDNLLALG